MARDGTVNTSHPVGDAAKMARPDSTISLFGKDANRRPSSSLLLLNNAHAKELSYLSPERMEDLLGTAFMACRVGEADAFLLAFDQDAAYDSPNFLWFRDRFERFVYVDRVVIDPAARGRGLARSLYEALFRRSEEAGHNRVVCEVNSDPPNPASDAFHAKMRFEEVGSALLPGGAKAVRYFSRALSAVPGPQRW
jgi:predicted GNAT superfamily acetyltransferase